MMCLFRGKSPHIYTCVFGQSLGTGGSERGSRMWRLSEPIAQQGYKQPQFAMRRCNPIQPNHLHRKSAGRSASLKNLTWPNILWKCWKLCW